MKKIYLIALLALFTTELSAQSIFNETITINDFSFKRHGDYMYLDMNIDLSSFDVKNNRATILSPRIVKGDKVVDLQSIGIYGRRRYFTYVRNDWSTLSNEGDMMYREKDCPQHINYKNTVPYEDWMNGAQVVIGNLTYGCCNNIINERIAELGSYKHYIYTPEFIYVRPTAEAVKSRSLSGSAYVDFVVSQTIIRPEYHNNRVELAKITSTIDSVRNDKDITITSISIKGYASPEGSYENNARLAKGRTESLRKYVSELYSFPRGFIETSYEPENWEGLRDYVENSYLEHRDEILEIIDGPRKPDNKEWVIKSNYKEEYRFLLENCYPSLRRSDYRIEYVVRSFSNPEEIRLLVKERPQKLSLEEFYLAAQSLDTSSEEFAEIFDVAVRMYPDDQIANLNAANSAMSLGNLKGAEKFLKNAGDSDQAIYARGVCAALLKDYNTALAYFDQVKMNIPQAVDAIVQVKNVMNNQ